MLWRLKRVEWTLSLGWKRVLLLTHSRGAFEGLTRLKAVLHRCSLNRSRMLHVVTTFSTYLMFEVLEVEWATLQDRLENDTHSLEDLIHAHDAYLNAIVERALLGAQHDELNAQLQRMLQSVLSFCALEDTLVQDAVSVLARKRSRLAAAAGGEGALDTSAASTATSRSSRAGGGDWNNEVGAEDPNSYDGVPAYVVQRLDGAVRDYSQQFDIFMNMLDSHGDNHTQDDSRTSHIARFLALRLDFNGYHAKVKAEGKSSMLLGTPPVIADTSATGSYASRAEAGKTRLSF
jgi:gamma-tubulin complex component 3